MQIEQYKGFKHFADRDPKRQIKYLVVHSFALPVKKMLEVCDKLGVGPHYIIDRKGRILQLVSEDKTAWHAGKSFWGGEESLNAASVGIELQNMTLGQTKYPQIQMDAFEWLAKQIMKRHNILPQNVVGHSDVAPTRKVDPGVDFPWAEMAKRRIGIWPDGKKVVSRKKAGTLLREIGYDTTDEKAALLAFMRHFMPGRVLADKEILRMEENLPGRIAAIPAPDKDVMTMLNQAACAYSQARTLPNLPGRRARGRG